MPDERLDSMQQGIGVPPESPAAMQADAERRERILSDPHPVPMESAMGGTSDADRAGDEAAMDAATGRGVGPGGTRDAEGAEGGDVVRESREAGQRAQGGGDSDEEDIRRASGGPGA